MKGKIYCYGCHEYHAPCAFPRLFDRKKDGVRKCNDYLDLTRPQDMTPIPYRVASEFDRLQRLSAEADARWLGVDDRLREMVQHYFSTGTRPAEVAK